MPSCPINSVDVQSDQMGLTPTDCPTTFPASDVCEEISFNMTGLGDTIGDATITYVYSCLLSTSDAADEENRVVVYVSGNT